MNRWRSFLGRIQGNRQRMGLAFGLGLLVAAGFLGGRMLISSVEADPPGGPVDAGPPASGTVRLPGPDETPIPGATPDITQPFWYVPYLNQDRLAAKFRGQLNGLEVGRASGPALQCDEVYRPDWQAAITGTPFDLDFSQLPKGVTLNQPPQVYFCSDGRPRRMEAILDVHEDVVGAGPGGAQVVISRWAGVRWWPEEAPASRWSTGNVNGAPAVFLDQPTDIAPIAEAAVFLADAETGGSTRIKGIGTTLELTTAIAEALTK